MLLFMTRGHLKAKVSGWVGGCVGGWVDGWLDWSLAASNGWLFSRVIDWLVVGWMVGSLVG